MTINYANKTIEITATKAKKAGVFGSDEYNDLVRAKNDNVGYRIVIVKARKSNNQVKGLTYEKMKNYLESLGDGCKSLLEEFNVMRNSNFKEGTYHPSKSYFEIRKWFLEVIKNKHNEMKEKELAEEAAKENIA